MAILSFFFGFNQAARAAAQSAIRTQLDSHGGVDRITFSVYHFAATELRAATEDRSGCTKSVEFDQHLV